MSLLGFQSGPGSFMWHAVLAKSDKIMSSQVGTLRFKVAKAGYGSSHELGAQALPVPEEGQRERCRWKGPYLHNQDG